MSAHLETQGHRGTKVILGRRASGYPGLLCIPLQRYPALDRKLPSLGTAWPSPPRRQAPGKWGAETNLGLPGKVPDTTFLPLPKASLPASLRGPAGRLADLPAYATEAGQSGWGWVDHMTSDPVQWGGLGMDGGLGDLDSRLLVPVSWEGKVDARLE